MTTTKDRFDLEVLDVAECDALLAEQVIGRIAFVADGDIDVFPVAYVMDGGSVAFRTAPGEKLSAAIMGRPVSFEIDAWDLPTRSGWSVLVKGVAEAVTDEDAIARLDDTGLEPWAPLAQRDRWIRILPHDITGRRVGRTPHLSRRDLLALQVPGARQIHIAASVRVATDDGKGELIEVPLDASRPGNQPFLNADELLVVCPVTELVQHATVIDVHGPDRFTDALLARLGAESAGDTRVLVLQIDGPADQPAARAQ